MAEKTLLDEFALEAMKHWKPEIWDPQNPKSVQSTKASCNWCASACYQYAQAMIEESEKRNVSLSELGV